MTRKFILYSIGMFLLIALITDLSQRYGVLLGVIHKKGHVLNLFFFILCLNVHFIGVYLQKKYPDQFAMLYMLIITIRMLGTLSFYVVLWKMKFSEDMSLTINFLLLYLCYTVFEISSLIVTLRLNLKR